MEKVIMELRLTDLLLVLMMVVILLLMELINKSIVDHQIISPLELVILQ